MRDLPSASLSFLQLSLLGAASARLARAVKYHGFSLELGLSADDLLVIVLVALAVAAPAGLSAATAVPAALLGLSWLGTLWLDAVLFRIYTIELGPHGVGSVILSVLYRELAELTLARRFFAEHRAFACLPLALVLAHAQLFLDGNARLVAGVMAALGLALATLSLAERARAMPLHLAAALAAVSLASRLPALASALPTVAVALIVTVAVATLRARGARAPASLRYLVQPRPLPDHRDVHPRPEHARLLALEPAAPRPSASHGLLAGSDVVLLSFESVGRDHLAAFSDGGAVTPTLQALLPRALVSRRHLCICPTTNDAHRALYHSAYRAGAPSAVHALAAAGYQTVYLTAARTREFGLRAILEHAGFAHVLDGEALGRGGRGSDHDLLTDGVAALTAARDERPLFLHVHATHTHVPYRVVDSARFGRFSDGDYGRFLNGIEETDWIFGALLEALSARGLTRSPLRVVTSDHGQAFGQLGYHSHGSAIIKDELIVPLVLAHPSLEPGAVGVSSHFDVLPTVLDLVGAPLEAPGFGRSLLAPPGEPPAVLVWAGHPSRATTSNYGFIVGKDKYMIDLALDRCWAMDVDDGEVRALAGDERRYIETLASRLMALRGVA